MGREEEEVVGEEEEVVGEEGEVEGEEGVVHSEGRDEVETKDLPGQGERPLMKGTHS